MSNANSSKPFIVLGVVAVIAIVGVFTMMGGKDSPTAPATVTFSSTGSEDLSDIVSALNKDTLGVVHVDPSQMGAFYKEVEKLFARVQGLSLTSKLQLPKGALEKPNFSRALRLSLESDPGSMTRKDIDDAVTMAENIENNLTGMTMMISRRPFTIPVEEGLKIPGIGMVLTFKESSNASSFMSLLQERINNSSELKNDKDVAVTVSDNMIQFALKDDGKNIDLFKLTTKEDKLWVLAGNTAPDAFTGGEALHDSETWKKVAGQSILNDSLLLTYFEPDAINQTLNDLGFFDSLAKIIEKREPGSKNVREEMEKARKQIFQNYEGFTASAASLSIHPSITSAQCALYTDKALFSDILDEFDSATLNKGAPGITSDLITERTVFALQFDGSLIDGYSEMFKNPKILDSYVPREDRTPEIDDFFKEINKYSSKLQALKISEYGVAVNAPPFGFNPEVGIVLTTSSGNADTLLKKVRTFMEDVMKSVDPSGMLSVSDFDSANGTKMLQVSTGTPHKLYGAPIGPKTIAFAQTPSAIENLKNTLSGDSYITKKAGNSRQKVTEIAKSQMTFYLSSVPALEIAKGMAPLMLQQVPANPPLDMSDVNQAVELMKFSLFGGQRIRSPQKGLLCSTYQQSLL